MESTASRLRIVSAAAHHGAQDGTTPVSGREVLQSLGIILSNLPEDACTVKRIICDVCGSKDFRQAPTIVKQMELLNRLGILDKSPLKSVVVVTSASRISLAMMELRAHNHPKRIVGSLRDHQWMWRTLAIVVASADEAIAVDFAGTSSLAALVFDENERATGVLDHFWDALGFRQPRVNWTARPRSSFLREDPGSRMDKGLLAILALKLPEVPSCAGFGDGTFIRLVCMFSCLWNSKAPTIALFHDWSDFLALIPGMLQDEEAVSLVLAPESRVLQISDFLRAFCRYMALPARVANLELSSSELNPRILVATPSRALEDVQKITGVRFLTIVEVDKLLEQQVESILSVTRSVQGISVHCTSTTFPEGVLSRLRQLYGSTDHDLCGWIIPRAQVSLELVFHFHAIANNKDAKLEKLCSIWKQLGMRPKASVFCSDPKDVGARIQSRGLPVCVTTKDMPTDVVEKLEHDFISGYSILVTNIYNRRSRVVLCLELPASAEDYLQRLGRDRDMYHRKIVINVLAPEEVPRLNGLLMELKASTCELPSNCAKLHTKSTRELRALCSAA